VVDAEDVFRTEDGIDESVEFDCTLVVMPEWFLDDDPPPPTRGSIGNASALHLWRD
jgi:hypothetical protein